MKKDRQLVLESTIVGALFVSILLVGSLVALGVPRQWSGVVNPANAPGADTSKGLSLYYNATLSLLGTGRYSNASLLLDTLDFANVPVSAGTIAPIGRSQLASMNVSMSEATHDILAANDPKSLNDSSYAAAGCYEATRANATLFDFKNSTIPGLTASGVPPTFYATGLSLTSDAVSSLLSRCTVLQSVYPTIMSGSGTLPPSPYPSADLKIWSRSESVVTGSSVTLFGNLTAKGEGIPGQAVLLYFNGTYIGTTRTNSSGEFEETPSLPFAYAPKGIVRAIFATNSTAGLGGAVSNLLQLGIQFNHTQITLADPPAYLPASSFTVHGNLTTNQGVPLSGAQIKLTFLNEVQNATTDSLGSFSAVLTVPANANDGVYYVYATFASQGVNGPSSGLMPIEVIHEPLKVTADLSSLTLAGYSTLVQGQLVTNGSGVAGAVVTVVSPWGSIQTVSNSTGGYALSVPTSPFDFASTADLTIRVDPTQPYIASAEGFAKLGLFNPLIVAIPLVAIGSLAYGAVSLSLMRRRRTRRDASAILTQEQALLLEPAALTKDNPAMVFLFLQTTGMAAERFQISFGRNLTLRETAEKIAQVSDPRTAGISTRVLMMAEEFLYAKTFDEARVKEAEGYVAELRELWKK